MATALRSDRRVVGQLFIPSGTPGRAMSISAFASLATLVLSLLQGWPLWGIAVAMLLPWTPVFFMEVLWTSRNYGWLALFYVLVVTQTGHTFEHLAQMVQIHALSRTGPDARGAFGALDIEWVHVVWNSWVLIGTILLLARFRANNWLHFTMIAAAWHEIEHLYIMSVYLDTGRAGTPGLLSNGGRILGGFPLTRPDLHFLYNLIEIIPLLVGFAVALRAAGSGLQAGRKPSGAPTPQARSRNGEHKVFV